MSQADNNMKSLADSLLGGVDNFTDALNKIQRIANAADSNVPEEVKKQVLKAQLEINKLQSQLADQLKELTNNLK